MAEHGAVVWGRMHASMHASDEEQLGQGDKLDRLVPTLVTG